MRVRVREVQAWQQVVVVAAINMNWLYILVSVFYCSLSFAVVLPEERVDSLYHNYTGGGITIDGPSILIRKNFDDKVSVSANYYVDNISSASIDVVMLASPYAERRVQTSIGADYLHNKSIISYNYTQSEEKDYDAITHYFGISQEMFGGLTTVNLAYALGDNIVTKTGDDSFEDIAGFKNYRTSVSQILTKNLILSLAYDIITDEGFLNNPYRQVRFISGAGFAFQPERYPRTRTSNAASFNLRYYLPYRAAVFGGYRYFIDTWGIQADTYEIGYLHPLEENWVFETNLRIYRQTEADFYNDLFPFEDAQNFLARDKEMSNFQNYTLGFGVSYEFETDSLSLFERGSANFYYSYINFDYNNFRDANATGFVVGNEPLYRFSANVLRLYLSFWF